MSWVILYKVATAAPSATKCARHMSRNLVLSFISHHFHHMNLYHKSPSISTRNDKSGPYQSFTYHNTYSIILFEMPLAKGEHMEGPYSIDKDKIKQDLIDKHLLGQQAELTKQRRIRTAMMSVLLVALISTFVFGTLENPFVYTFSNIGNLFDYRFYFIIWAIVCGLSIQASVIALFRLEHYYRKSGYVFVGLAAFFLVITAIIPALRELYPFWLLIHTVCAGIHALFMLMTLIPFVSYVSINNPRLRLILMIWMLVIVAGSTVALVLFGKTGMFELWFFATTILFLLYLSLILFEEKIVKLSSVFLKDEKDLDYAIEKIYINLEQNEKKKVDKKEI